MARVNTPERSGGRDEGMKWKKPSGADKQIPVKGTGWRRGEGIEYFVGPLIPHGYSAPRRSGNDVHRLDQRWVPDIEKNIMINYGLKTVEKSISSLEVQAERFSRMERGCS